MMKRVRTTGAAKTGKVKKAKKAKTGKTGKTGKKAKKAKARTTGVTEAKAVAQPLLLRAEDALLIHRALHTSCATHVVLTSGTLLRVKIGRSGRKRVDVVDADCVASHARYGSVVLCERPGLGSSTNIIPLRADGRKHPRADWGRIAGGVVAQRSARCAPHVAS